MAVPRRRGPRGVFARESRGPRTGLESLGCRPLINACGVYTDLGGSILSPRVWAAMEQSNRSFVSMTELLEKSGRVLAELVGTEHARVTTGAAAAIALGTAACLTGMDGDAWERLPDLQGLSRIDLVIQRRHRYKYDRCARLTGGRLVEVGDDGGTTTEQLAAALGPSAGVLLFPAHLDGRPGTVTLENAARLAHERGVPTLVDAAYLNDPPETMRRFAAAGADLVCFSSKYYGGPNGGGFIAGSQRLIDTVAGIDFTRFESGRYRTFGRPFKLDRQIIVAVVVALQEWFAIDHRARWAGYRAKVDRVIDEIEELPGLEVAPRGFTLDERLIMEPVNCVAIGFGPESGLDCEAVCRALREGDPAIATVTLGGKLIVAMDTVQDGDERIISRRLREVVVG